MTYPRTPETLAARAAAELAQDRRNLALLRGEIARACEESAAAETALTTAVRHVVAAALDWRSANARLAETADLLARGVERRLDDLTPGGAS